MKKYFNWNTISALMISAVFMVLAAGSTEPTEVSPVKPDTPVDNGPQLVPITEGIGNWDEAYATADGFWCISNDLSKLDSEFNPGDGESYGAICETDRAGAPVATIIFHQSDWLPVQIITSDMNLYFSYLNSETLEIFMSQGETRTLLATITYEADYLTTLLAQIKNETNNSLQCLLQYMLNIVGTNLDAYAVLSKLIDNYRIVVTFVTGENNNITDGLTKDGTDYAFATEANNQAKGIMIDVVYRITLWTGDASFKVGGSSCTLSGSVYCGSPTYNDYGTYGVLVDENPANLTVNTADYVMTAYQGPDDTQFEVDFRGFKPNTTYYYVSYYAFNSSDHGDLKFKEGDPDAEIYYDSVVKSFTTGDNLLTVDVVMCIDITGSMSGIINTVKSNAMAFYDLFKSRCEDQSITLTGLTCQVVAFGDINVDGSRGLNSSPTYQLPDQKADFNSYVSGLYASGGGDTPESGLEALDLAFSKTDWGVDDGYHRQVVILWTDAPYLIGSGYTSLTAAEVQSKWNTLPSGRRMILFAPTYTDGSNSGSWDTMSRWTNVILNTDTSASFSDFAVSLDAIIGELTSRGTTVYRAKNAITKPRPNY